MYTCSAVGHDSAFRTRGILMTAKLDNIRSKLRCLKWLQIGVNHMTSFAKARDASRHCGSYIMEGILMIIQFTHAWMIAIHCHTSFHSWVYAPSQVCTASQDHYGKFAKATKQITPVPAHLLIHDSPRMLIWTPLTEKAIAAVTVASQITAPFTWSRSNHVVGPLARQHLHQEFTHVVQHVTQPVTQSTHTAGMTQFSRNRNGYGCVEWYENDQKPSFNT